MPTPASFVPLDQLLQNARASLVRNNTRAAPSPTSDTAFVTGFHVYSDIHLTLSLAAAEDNRSAQQYLDVLAAYADIAAGAAQVAGARLLEFQGERIHFLLEVPPGTGTPTPDLWKRLLALSHAVITLAYEKLEPMAGEHWRGCRVAADFGPAALLYSPCGNGSLVSLGDCANQPAKRLGQSPMVTAGHLAIPQRLTPRDLGGTVIRQWTEINLRTPAAAIRQFIGADFNQPLRNFLTEAARRDRVRPVLGQVTPQFFEGLGSGQAVQPVQLQGFVFRADLDGFTKQVQAAFANGPAAVHALVQRFRALLEFPQQFAAALNGRVVILPWAGDCANALVLPPVGESFHQARNYLPVRAAFTWHNSFEAERRFAESAGTARWNLGLAAGDANEGHEGRVLLADLPAGDRTFRVLAGWAARRSSDAYQCDGVIGGDTVITRIDRDHLWAKHAASFADLETDFARASIDQLRKDSTDLANSASKEAPRSSVGPAIPVPVPHYGRL